VLRGARRSRCARAGTAGSARQGPALPARRRVARAAPEKELRAFAKVELAPGERRDVRFTLPARAFAAWDPGAKEWVAEPGEFEVLVGASSREICARAAVVLEPA
jgi:beta-glucosidase